MDNSDSFNRVLGQLDRGSQGGLAELEARYRKRLAGLIHKRLTDGDIVETDDVIQSVLFTFWKRWQDGRASNWSFHGWDDLWRLLAEITRRRCVHYRRRAHQRKRDVNRKTRIEDSAAESLVSGEPSPEERVIFVDTLEALLKQLNEEARLVVLRRLEGATKEELAGELNCGVRTINRRLERGLKILEDLLQENDDEEPDSI